MKDGGERNFRAELKMGFRDHFRSLPLDNCFGVSLTMKQCADGEWLDEVRASKNLRLFMNQLNGAVFGKRFRRFGARLKVIPFLERSSSGRLHYHLVLENPFPASPDSFERLIEATWSQTPFGYYHAYVDQQIDHGWTDYISKTKTASDGLDGENYYWA